MTKCNDFRQNDFKQIPLRIWVQTFKGTLDRMTPDKMARQIFVDKMALDEKIFYKMALDWKT